MPGRTTAPSMRAPPQDTLPGTARCSCPTGSLDWGALLSSHVIAQ